MKRIVGTALILTVSLLLSHAPSAQETTERYIPIGESPGVSGIESVIGTIDSVDRDEHTMVVRHAEGTTTVWLADATRFYVDRSKSRLPNGTGSFADCEIGRRVEVKLGDEGVADWVKVEG